MRLFLLQTVYLLSVLYMFISASEFLLNVGLSEKYSADMDLCIYQYDVRAVRLYKNLPAGYSSISITSARSCVL